LEKVPVATNCRVSPGTMLVLAGVTVMEVGVAVVPLPHPARIKSIITNNEKRISMACSLLLTIGDSVRVQ
jgi:hypothetical protein